LRRLGAHAHPVLDPIRLELHALVGVGDHRVVSAQLLDDAPVARLPAVDGHDAEIRAVFPPQPFHAKSNCHVRDSPSKKILSPRPRARRRRLLLSITSGLRRSSFVLASMIPFKRDTAFSGSSPSGISSPIPGMLPMMSFMLPILASCSNCLRKSSSVKSPSASF